MDKKSKIKINSLYCWCIENHKEQLLKEWDYEKNGNVTPKDIAKASNIKFNWICSKCGHRWMANPSHRTNGRGCPKCAIKKVADRYSTVTNINDSVLVKYPNIAKEWDYDKNDRGPETYYPQSNIKVWWKCSKCHSEWETSIAHRCSRNSGCPVCSNIKVVKGLNDLFTIKPELEKDWDFDKNTIDPYALSVGSKKKVWWKCERGHSWQAVVYSRTSDYQSRSCPKCNSEKRTSLPEKIIYFYVKQFFLDAKENYRPSFLKQKELDIYIPSISTGIEYDGKNWHKNVKRDILKDELCSKNNIKLFRIREDGLDDYYSSSIKIKCGKYKNDCLYLTEPIKELLKHLGIENLDINIAKDYESVIGEFLTIKKEETISSHPMMAEWDYEKNKNVNPEFISLHSNRKFWWKCNKCGYEWKVSPAHRARGHKCAVCAGQVVKKGVNDLLSQEPELAKEWNYQRNIVKPDEVTVGTNKKVWWICSICHHEWQATIYSRHSGCVCPECMKTIVSEKQSKANYADSIAFRFPEIVKEWDYSKNTVKPDEVYPNSNLKFWWKCKNCGLSWEAVVHSRTKRNSGCPYCSGRFAIPGVNDLATLMPELIEEWNFNKNTIDPHNVKIASGKEAYWICKKCGYEWKTKISVRSRGCGCPKCAKKVK